MNRKKTRKTKICNLFKCKKALAWRYILAVLLGLIILLIIIVIVGKGGTESSNLISRAKDLF